MKPDLAKVAAAVEAIEARRRATRPAFRELPLKPVTAQDAAIRKELKSHGCPCTGFTYYHFLNRD